jgi:hypothetical protein
LTSPPSITERAIRTLIELRGLGPLAADNRRADSIFGDQRLTQDVTGLLLREEALTNIVAIALIWAPLLPQIASAFNVKLIELGGTERGLTVGVGVRVGRVAVLSTHFAEPKDLTWCATWEELSTSFIASVVLLTAVVLLSTLFTAYGCQASALRRGRVPLRWRRSGVALRRRRGRVPLRWRRSGVALRGRRHRVPLWWGVISGLWFNRLFNGVIFTAH